MRITPDFSESNEQQIIPTGTYPVRIMAAEPAVSKAGNNMIKWTLSIFGAEGEYAKLNNRQFFYRTMTSGAAAGRLRDMLKALDVDASQGFDTEELVGKEALAVLVEGKTPEGEPSPWPDVKTIKKFRQ